MGVVKESNEQEEVQSQPKKSRMWMYVIIAIILLLIIIAVVYFMKKRNANKELMLNEQNEKRKEDNDIMKRLDYLCNTHNEFNRKLDAFQADTNKKIDAISNKVDNIKVTKHEKRLNEVEES